MAAQRDQASLAVQARTHLVTRGAALLCALRGRHGLTYHYFVNSQTLTLNVGSKYHNESASTNLAKRNALMTRLRVKTPTSGVSTSAVSTTYGSFDIVRVPGEQTLDGTPIWNELQQGDPRVIYLQAAFDQALTEGPKLCRVLEIVDSVGGKVCVLGGWVRDQLRLFSGNPEARAPRDIDLVVVGADHAQLIELLDEQVRRTVLGGFSLKDARTDIDLWCASDTFLTNLLGMHSDLPHVLAVTDFSINAAIFMPSQCWPHSRFIDAGCLQALSNNLISFHFEWLPLPTAQIARLLTFSRKLRFSLDQSILNFIKSEIRRPGVVNAVLENLAIYETSTDMLIAKQSLFSLTRARKV